MNFDCIDETRCGNEEPVAFSGQAGVSRVAPVLSPRQQEILLAASRGKTDKSIAETLGVSPRTMEAHWRAIHRKLGSITRCQAGFIFAVLQGNSRVKVLV